MAPNRSPRIERAEDTSRQALAIGLELAKNATRARTLEELQFVLVNDTRALVPFDRAMLVVHFEGDSKLIATNNQPTLEGKSDFVGRLNDLAPVLRGLERGLVLSSEALKAEDLPGDIGAALSEYVTYSQCACLIVVPLSLPDHVIGHLMLEFFGDSRPGRIETLTLMNMVPFFSSALAQKWVLENRPAVRKSFMRAISGRAVPLRRQLRLKVVFAVVVPLLVATAMWLPVTLKVGGRAEVAPDREHYAFVETDGVVKEVLTRTGASVKKGQVVAVLDPLEIDYEIKEAERTLESHKAEVEILRNLGAEDASKLAEAQLAMIRTLRARQKVEYLQWKRKFLEIHAPDDGVVLDEKLESLVGKKFSAGEAFCTVASPEQLLVEILVKESDASYLKPGQAATIFFNFSPEQGHPLVVKSIPPKFEATAREGNAFRVKAEFVGPRPEVKPGMLGVAHVDAGDGSLWFVLTRRIVTRLREMTLMF
ncbi:MAG: efflux RND transporter periplasmic adaptor subunit [Thermodesulfobacteriota bacterium]